MVDYKTYKFKLKILTPIIVHNGSKYDFINIIPLNNKIYLVDMQKMLSKMTEVEQDDFLNYCSASDFTTAREIIKKKISSDKSLIIKESETSNSFYQEIIKNPVAEVAQIFKNDLTGKAFIPGSSIKGAIRTAVLEEIRKKLNLEPRNRNANFEGLIINNMHLLNDKNKDAFNINSVLGKIDTHSKWFNPGVDPFKFLKVSDFELDNDAIRYLTVRVKGKNGLKGIPIYTEATESYETLGKEVIARGTISLKINPRIDGKYYENLLNIDQILEYVYEFYSDLLVETKNHEDKYGIIKLLDAQKLDANSTCIKLGRYTQIESKTFKIERFGEHRISRDINISGGVSRSLIEGEMPAGWAVLELED